MCAPPIVLWLQVRAAHRDLRDLCSLMGGQIWRFRSLLEYAGKSAEDLRDRVRQPIVCELWQ